MSKSPDWLPNSREEQLSMAINWVSVLEEALHDGNNAEGSRAGGGLRETRGVAGWGIPASVINHLGVLVSEAEAALFIAKNEETRTRVATVHCREAFDSLTSVMGDIRKRWFHVPPLHNADLVALGLEVPDTPFVCPVPPTAQVTVETWLVARHELGVKIIYVEGSPDDLANKGYRLWYSVAEPGEPAPGGPDDLRKSFYTKRKKDVIDFDLNDSGKRAFFAVQVENEGKKGPWGPLVPALIP